MDALKVKRVSKNFSQKKLGELLGVSQQTVNKWESGASKPSSDKLPRLAEILGCTIDALFAAS